MKRCVPQVDIHNFSSNPVIGGFTKVLKVYGLHLYGITPPPPPIKLSIYLLLIITDVVQIKATHLILLLNGLPLCLLHAFLKGSSVIYIHVCIDNLKHKQCIS